MYAIEAHQCETHTNKRFLGGVCCSMRPFCVVRLSLAGRLPQFLVGHAKMSVARAWASLSYVLFGCLAVRCGAAVLPLLCRCFRCTFYVAFPAFFRIDRWCCRVSVHEAIPISVGSESQHSFIKAGKIFHLHSIEMHACHRTGCRNVWHSNYVSWSACIRAERPLSTPN